ncbi:hypothetical protein BK652_19700 [Pseudomonas brassicacearum]|uniref:Uncharacterized protein n=1 Tax=Pseudomonas brassicacearum TaxID=930166 RepID=A0A423G2X1_9PSED|nr:hypothetical protein [Pseudomonas brassicacearum]ROM79719.1 hypothetical protein BK652_19700 [Pseudomonas brassicacearum]
MNVERVVDLEGWLVIIDYRLFLMPEFYSDDYEGGEKVEVSNPEIIFSIMDKILPLAGGKSFIFHRSKISGTLIEGLSKKIRPLELFVEERGGGYVAIDVDDRTIEKYKARYRDFLNAGGGGESDDWLDYL